MINPAIKKIFYMLYSNRYIVLNEQDFPPLPGDSQPSLAALQILLSPGDQLHHICPMAGG